MIVAIDGPAASGKGTIGRLLAGHLGLHFLDTGLLYRGVAFALLGAGFPVESEENAVALARGLSLDGLDESVLGAPEIGAAASKVAAMPAVRAALFDRQQAFAAQEPGTVLVGRDIGTVVCPDADAKIFLTAAPETRAERRAAQLALHDEASVQAVLDDILARDKRDMERAVAPLRMADDARLLDTTELDIEAALRAAIAIVEEAAGSKT